MRYCSSWLSLLPLALLAWSTPTLAAESLLVRFDQPLPQERYQRIEPEAQFQLLFAPTNSTKQETGEDPKQQQADDLLQQGIEQYSVSQFQDALQSWETALTIYRELGYRAGEAKALNNIGLVNEVLGSYPQALDYYEQSLVITRELGDRATEAGTLTNIGIVNALVGNYKEALDYYQRGLIITREIGDRSSEAKILTNIGIVNDLLGNYAEALNHHQQGLVIAREIGDRATEALALNNIGIVNQFLRNYEEALNYYQQSLIVTREIGDRATEALTLNNIGIVNRFLRNYEEALDYYQQSLIVTREIGNRSSEAKTLNNIGIVNRFLGNYEEALDYYQQSLVITREIGSPVTEAQTFNNIGTLFKDQNQSELAIVFYKQAVNTFEGIRATNIDLDTSLQESYTAIVEDTYRTLADLLIEQGRLAEAQRVMELLKVQELQEFTRSAELTETQGSIPLIALEREILAEFDGTLLELARELYECELSQCSRLSDLRDQLDAQTLVFNAEVETFRKDLQDQFAKDPGLLSADTLSKTAREVVTAQDGIGTVLVYPLVLEDRVRILIAVRAGENGVAFRAVETTVTQEDLWVAVDAFRDLLETPYSDLEAVQAQGAQLYDWLIAPLEQELSAEEIDHLVFALDRSTRYIPMSALFDTANQQYLVEKYAISTILGTDLTDMSDRLSANAQDNAVLGLGLSIPVEGFNPLPNVANEVNAIVQTPDPDDAGIFPGQALFDDAFTYENLRDALAGNRVLHIATHAKFELGLPQNSFLLGGEGKITIDRIQLLNNYGLDDVHLVVLSACETARGGPDDNGIEVPGISYYFLGGGAKSVMASLWLVEDGTTSLLMQEFYNQLATPDQSKAAALRATQIAMIQSDATVLDGWQRGGFELLIPDGADRDRLAHPYYWAPFILIGNGL
jgi:CHAT domain-containing protein